MRRRIGAEKKARIAARGRRPQCFPVYVALEDGQAIQMRADATGEHMAAVIQQVMDRDRRANFRVGISHEFARIPGS